MKEKIRVDLCHDHFQRLVTGDTCELCPSQLENESAVRAVAALHGATDSEKFAGTVNEIHSIRRTLSEIYRDLQAARDAIIELDRKVSGNNGTKGLQTRMTIMETRQDVAQKNTGTIVAIGTAIVSAGISIAALLIK